MIKKILLVILVFIFGFLVSNLAKAADVNGYTAQYECKAGGANCNVDVVSYGNAACQQTIHVSDAWSTINWAADVICIEAGDHTAKGTLTLGSSGTSGTRKVLRYYRSGDTDDDPWDQSDANKVKIADFKCLEKDYWIIHRLTFWQTSANNQFDNNGCQYMIYNRMLVDGRDLNPTASRPLWLIKGVSPDYRSNDFTTVQNSVIRSSGKRANSDLHCINAGGKDVRFVNNEIYDCGGDGIVMDDGSDPFRNIVENNDVYQTSNYLIACDGSAGTTCNCGEDGVDVKDNSNTVAELIQVIHNRIWGQRTTYETCSGSGSYGYGINSGGTAATEYVLIKNNIVMSTANGINMRNDVSHHRSAIGNLLYDINHGHAPSDVPSNGDGDHSIAFRYDGSADYGEAYLNTVISSEEGFVFSSGETNHDILCNTFIDVSSIRKDTNVLGTGSIVDYNVFYGTTEYTTESPDNDLGNYTLNTRANSQAYNLGDIIRTTATPPEDGTAGDFLYRVTTAGTSAGSPPAYCTTLGCSTTDGTMVVQAIRGPYSFYSNLRTTPVLVYIPYAKVHNSAPEYAYCPNTTGSNTGRGINDQTGTW